MRERLFTAVTRLANIGAEPSDSEDDRLRKGTLTFSGVLFIIAAIIWATAYALLGLYRAAAVPLAYAALSVATLVSFALTKRYAPFRFAQLLLILLLPLGLQRTLGGFPTPGP